MTYTLGRTYQSGPGCTPPVARGLSFLYQHGATYMEDGFRDRIPVSYKFHIEAGAEWYHIEKTVRGNYVDVALDSL